MQKRQRTQRENESGKRINHNENVQKTRKKNQIPREFAIRWIYFLSYKYHLWWPIGSDSFDISDIHSKTNRMIKTKMFREFGFIFLFYFLLYLQRRMLAKLLLILTLIIQKTKVFLILTLNRGPDSKRGRNSTELGTFKMTVNIN